MKHICDYMDYDKFLKEWETYNKWEKKNDGIAGVSNDDVIRLGDSSKGRQR